MWLGNGAVGAGSRLPRTGEGWETGVGDVSSTTTGPALGSRMSPGLASRAWGAPSVLQVRGSDSNFLSQNKGNPVAPVTNSPTGRWRRADAAVPASPQTRSGSHSRPVVRARADRVRSPLPPGGRDALRCPGPAGRFTGRGALKARRAGGGPGRVLALVPSVRAAAARLCARINTGGAHCRLRRLYPGEGCRPGER